MANGGWLGAGAIGFVLMCGAVVLGPLILGGIRRLSRFLTEVARIRRHLAYERRGAEARARRLP